MALYAVRSPVLRDMVSLPELPTTDAVLCTVAGMVELAGLVLFYIQYHSGIDGYPRSTNFGYVLALIGSVLTVAAGVISVRAGHDVLHEMPAPAAAPAPPPPPGPVAFSGSTGDYPGNARSLRTTGTARTRGTPRTGSVILCPTTTATTRPAGLVHDIRPT